MEKIRLFHLTTSHIDLTPQQGIIIIEATVTIQTFDFQILIFFILVNLGSWIKRIKFYFSLKVLYLKKNCVSVAVYFLLINFCFTFFKIDKFKCLKRVFRLVIITKKVNVLELLKPFKYFLQNKYQNFLNVACTAIFKLILFTLIRFF